SADRSGRGSCVWIHAVSDQPGPTRRTAMKATFVLISTIIAGCAIMHLSARSPSAQTAPSYIGSEACKSCHEDKWTVFQNSAHARAEMDSTRIADHTGCESCHGPGSLHAEAAGDKSNPGYATIRNLARMKPGESSEVCAACHKSGDQFYWQHSDHSRANVGCLGCHTIHHAQSVGAGPMLKKADVNHLCLTCHIDKRAALERSGHMPLREGSMNCGDCHNPHGSPAAHQLRAGTVNELCTKCHADKRGPFLWEHAPVRENCLNCHQPHGSNNEKVLGAKRPYLCQRCHVGTRHPSTLYDNPDLAT